MKAAQHPGEEESAETCYQQGLDYVASLDDERAIAAFSKALDLDPKLTNAYFTRGRACHRLRDYDRAVADYTTTIELGVTRIRSYYWRGECHEALGRYDAAIEDFEAVIELSAPRDDYDREKASERIDAIRDKKGELARTRLPEPEIVDSKHEPSDASPAANSKAAASTAYGWIVLVVSIGVPALGFFIATANRTSSESQTARPVSTAPVTVGKSGSPLLNRRLANGTIIRSRRLRGKGHLQVENGLDRDAVVKLVKRGSQRYTVFFYVRSNSTHEITRIPDGEYNLFFCSGTDWDKMKKSFKRDKSFSRFRDSSSWTTTKERRHGGTHWVYSVHRVALHPVRGGTARTDALLEADFSRLK